jgi:hypothetical protein
MQISIDRVYQRVLSVALGFRDKFTTEEFIARFAAKFPKTWNRLVLSYGWPGKNAGQHYTAASRVAHIFVAHANRGRITRLGYVKSSANWGSPVVLQFRV